MVGCSTIYVVHIKYGQIRQPEAVGISAELRERRQAGWICYAEKQLGSFVLPYISSVKSPQQTIGAIVKAYVCQSIMGLRPQEVYHVTVMPCYDKKLEAAWDDFVFRLESHAEGHEGEVNMISEVDSVLTTGEILELIQVEGKTVLKIASVTVFRTCKTLYENLKLGNVIINSFKSWHALQKYWNRMLIEAGCLNGGGQIKPMSGQSPKGLSQLLESVYMENVRSYIEKGRIVTFGGIGAHNIYHRYNCSCYSS